MLGKLQSRTLVSHDTKVLYSISVLVVKLKKATEVAFLLTLKSICVNIS